MAVRDRAASLRYVAAISAFQSRRIPPHETPIATALNLNDAQKLKIKQLFKIAYFIAKKELSFTTYPQLALFRKMSWRRTWRHISQRCSMQ